MKTRFATHVYRAFALLALPLFVGRALAADSVEEIAARVRDRESQVSGAIASGQVQENAQGLLQASPSADQATQQLVTAENRDRRAAFALLGKQLNASPAAVAAIFARMAHGRTPAPASTPDPAGRPSATPPAAPEASPSGAPPLPSPGPSAPAAPGPAQTKPGTSIPLKVITRMASTVYASPSDSAAPVESNIAALTVYYVYDQQPGWLQVGKSVKGGPFGWIKEKDAILYKQNLAMVFTQPANRLPVFFFRDKTELKKMVEEPAGQRASEADGLLSKINSGNIPSDFPVDAMEPNRATDHRATPYILPITDHERLQIDGRDGRLLEVAGVTKSRTDKAFPAPGGPGVSSASGAATLDVVFVMDCSSSMRPMVDATIDAMRGMVSKLSGDAAVKDGLRLGFWGYRDSSPDQDFDGAPVKNFTPTLEPAPEFLKTLQKVEVSKNSAGDYAEDVYGGLHRAIEETQWRPDSLRVIVLVGDASAHGAGHAKNSSKMDADQLRQLANQKNVYVTSYYILRNSPLAGPDRQIAERQFRKIAENRNAAATGENFVLVEQGDLSRLASAFGKSSEALATQLADLRSGKAPTSQPAPAKPGENVEDAALRMANNMFSGAYVDWLARQKDTAQAPPGNIQSWVVDRDLKDPAVRPMEVVVLLRKNEVDAMAKVLDNIVTAGVRGQVTGQDFFQALQSVAASAVSSPDQIRNARNLAGTGLLPGFLQDLPYESRLMKMDPATWNSLSVDSQNEILEQIRAKITFYENTLRDTSQWVAFNPGDEEDDKVASVPLEQLP